MNGVFTRTRSLALSCMPRVLVATNQYTMQVADEPTTIGVSPPAWNLLSIWALDRMHYTRGMAMCF